MPPRPLNPFAINPVRRAAETTDPAEEYDRLWQTGPLPDLADFVARAGTLSSAQLVAILLVDQRARWNLGEQVLAETYLAEYPRLADDPELQEDLIYGELLLREQHGERQALEAIAARFPDLAEMLRQQIGLHRALCGASEPETLVGRPAKHAPLRPDSVFFVYEIVREIGRGGSGVVYEARQTGVNRSVALKVLSAGPEAGCAQYARFRAEAELIGRLQHPHIVQIFDAGEHDGRPFLAMEFVSGGSLRDSLNGTPQPPECAARLVETLARAIHSAHTAGIVHRDLKPGNILFARSSGEAAVCGGPSPAWPADAVPKIGDFGLAKSLPDGADQSPSGSVTRTGDIIGTPSYMSPEQAAGRFPVGPPGDIYALGAVLYELLTGRPPFRGVSALETLQQVVSTEPIPPSQLQPRLPRDLGIICLKCLQKQPAQRYGSALELADDLARFLANRPINARPVPGWVRLDRWRRRNPLPAALAAMVAVLLTALVLGTLAATIRLREAADARLIEARLAEARAVRLSDAIGRREASRSLLAEAARIRSSAEIRNEAIAGMALFDLPVAGTGPEFLRQHLVLSFDGRLSHYARADREGHVTVHRVSDDAEICRIPKTIPNTIVLMSPDGRCVATHWMARDEVEFWSVSESPARLVLSEVCHSVYGFGAVDFNRDGELIAVGRPDGTVVVRSIPPGRFLREWHVGSPPSHVAFHPHEPQLAIAARQGVEVRDYRSGRLLVRLDNSAGANRVAWHPQGLLLATADRNHSISLWQPPDFKCVRTLPGHGGGGMELQFSASGTMLASHAWDNVLQFWAPSDGRLLLKMGIFTLPALCCAVDRDLWSGDVLEGRVRFWQADDDEVYHHLVSDFTPADESYLHLDVSPSSVANGRLLAAARKDSVRFWDLRSRREIGRLAVRSISRVRFDPSGALLTNGAAGIQRWPIRESADVRGELIVGPPTLLWETGTNSDMAISADARTIALGDTSGAFVVTPGQPDSMRRLQGHPDARYATVTPDGRWVATGSHNGTNVNIWEARTGKPVRELRLGGSRVAFSPDGKWLSIVSDGLTVWSIGDWNRVWHKEGEGFSAQAFTADGRYLAAETGAGAVVLYAAATGREVARLSDPQGRNQVWLAFSRDARFLAALPYNSKAVSVWNLGEAEDRLEKLGAGGERISSPDRVHESRDQLVLAITARGEEPVRGLEKSLDEITERIRQNPTDQVLHGARGRILNELNRPEDAVRELTVAIDIAPDVSLYALRARAHAAANNYVQAIGDLATALSILKPGDSRESSLSNQLAWYCLTGPSETRQPERALALARRASDGEAGSGGYFQTLGIAHCRCSEWKPATDMLQCSLAAGSSTPAHDWYFLALGWHNLGNARLAADFFDQAVYWHDTHEPRLDWLSRRELQDIRREVEEQLSLAENAGPIRAPSSGGSP